MDWSGFIRGSRRWLDANRTSLTWLAAVLFGLVVVLLLAAKVVPGWPEAADLDAGRRQYTLDPTVRAIVSGIIFFDQPWVAALTVVVVGAVGWSQLGLVGAVQAPAAASVVILASVGKQLPPAGSLPSGHASYAVALFGYAAWLCLRARQRWMAVVLVVLALLTGPAKVVAATHVSIDVVAGDALGAGWLIAVLLAGRTLARTPA